MIQVNVVPDHMAPTAMIAMLPDVALIAKASGMSFKHWSMICRKAMIQSHRGIGETIPQFIERVRAEVFLVTLTNEDFRTLN